MSAEAWRLAAALVLLAAAPAQAEDGAGQHGRLCAELAQRVQALPQPVEKRQLDFLVFDAAERGCDDQLAGFLDAGASAVARDGRGDSALNVAARMGQTASVELLLARGAEIDHPNLVGATPLLNAVTARRRATAEALLEAGADPDRPDGNGLTPLIAAAFNGDGPLVQTLIEKGADPATVDKTGKSAIVYAAARGRVAIVADLLAAGVAPGAVYGHDLTVLMWAAGHANDAPEADGLATVEELIAAGAPIGPADDRGRTALMIAAERGHPKIVARLLVAGADPGVRDKAGLTASDLAADDAVRAALGGG